jgi:hypothetical protein
MVVATKNPPAKRAGKIAPIKAGNMGQHRIEHLVNGRPVMEVGLARAAFWAEVRALEAAEATLSPNDNHEYRLKMPKRAISARPMGMPRAPTRKP